MIKSVNRYATDLIVNALLTYFTYLITYLLTYLLTHLLTHSMEQGPS